MFGRLNRTDFDNYKIFLSIPVLSNRQWKCCQEGLPQKHMVHYLVLVLIYESIYLNEVTSLHEYDLIYQLSRFIIMSPPLKQQYHSTQKTGGEMSPLLALSLPMEACVTLPHILRARTLSSFESIQIIRSLQWLGQILKLSSSTPKDLFVQREDSIICGFLFPWETGILHSYCSHRKLKFSLSRKMSPPLPPEENVLHQTMLHGES